MGGYLFDRVLFHLAGVSHKLWLPEDFASDHLILNLLIHRTINKLLQLYKIDGGDISMVCINLYFMRT